MILTAEITQPLFFYEIQGLHPDGLSQKTRRDCYD